MPLEFRVYTLNTGLKQSLSLRSLLGCGRGQEAGPQMSSARCYSSSSQGGIYKLVVKSDFAGELPVLLYSVGEGLSFVSMPKVAAPASDPTLRKLPRSVWVQSSQVSTFVSRCLQSKPEQRMAKNALSSQRKKVNTHVQRSKVKFDYSQRFKVKVICCRMRQDKVQACKTVCGRY